MEIDRIDRKIIRELARDARITQGELSERVGLSPTACARRQAALETGGLIVGYAATFNLSELDLRTTVIVRIRLASQNEQTFSAFESAVVNCSSVTRCFLIAGSEDYILIVLARDMDDFEHIHKNQLARLPGVAGIQSNCTLRSIVNREVPPRVLIE